MRVICGPDDEAETILVARGSGKLDVHGATHFWEAVHPRVTDEMPSLIVDMSEVELMTSAGIGVLIRLLNHAEPLGGTVALFGCNEGVRRVLQICELEDDLHVCDSVEEARAAVQG